MAGETSMVQSELLPELLECNEKQKKSELQFEKKIGKESFKQ